MHDLAYTGLTRGVGKPNGGQNIRVSIEKRILNGLPNVDLSRKVEDDLRAQLIDDRIDLPRPNVCPDEFHVGVVAEIRRAAAAEVVNDSDLVSMLNELVDEVGTDEPGSAGDNGAHGDDLNRR